MGALNCTGEAFEAVDCTPELCPGMYGLHHYMQIVDWNNNKTIRSGQFDQ